MPEGAEDFMTLTHGFYFGEVDLENKVGSGSDGDIDDSWLEAAELNEPEEEEEVYEPDWV